MDEQPVPVGEEAGPGDVDADRVAAAASEAAEYKHAWLENFFTIDEIKSKIETCDKSCSTCNEQDKNDCLLECKEYIYSMATMFKDFLKHLLRGTLRLVAIDTGGEPPGETASDIYS